MAKTFENRPLGILSLLLSLGFEACRASEASSHGKGAEKPIDVASVIAGCKDLDECSRQCVENRPSGCLSAGRLYEFGHGVAADPSRAFRLYEQACGSNYAGGCYNAAVLLEAGKGVERDLVRARLLYAKVCQMGSKTSCERARTLGDGGQR